MASESTRRLSLRMVLGLVAIVFIGQVNGAHAQTILVASPEDLDNVRTELAADYIQVADINLANCSLTPIGALGSGFTGSYDGNGYKISNFQYAGAADEDQVGLFGYVDGAELRDITLESATVSGRNDVGCLVGYAFGSVIDSCTVRNAGITVPRSSASGELSVGGLIGRTHASLVSGCVSYADSHAAERWSGSAIGHIHKGCDVVDSHAYGRATGGHAVGGFSGNIHGSTVEDCSASGDVEALSVCGGFTGYFHTDAGLSSFPSIARNCSASGNVLSTAAEPLSFRDGDGAILFLNPSTGGFTGWLEPDSIVESCTAAGNVTSPIDQPYQTIAGGLIGFAKTGCEVRACSASGLLAIGDTAGGLIGWAEDGCLVENCVAYTDSSGVWQMGGLVGAADRITIRECIAFGDVAATGIPDNEHAEPGKLTAAAGGLVGYSFPGDGPFATRISKSSAHGDVVANGQFTGGLVGFLWGTELRECYSTGSVTGDDRRIGGLVGGVVVDNGNESDELSIIVDCFTTGSITQNTIDPNYQGWAGGLIGYLEGGANVQNSVSNCYSIGWIDAQGPHVGGLVGRRASNASVTASYWDTQTSGQSGSAGGEGKTTAEMKQRSTFDGWDFEMTPIWGIDEGVTYPYLLRAP